MNDNALPRARSRRRRRASRRVPPVAFDLFMNGSDGSHQRTDGHPTSQETNPTIWWKDRLLGPPASAVLSITQVHVLFLFCLINVFFLFINLFVWFNALMGAFCWGVLLHVPCEWSLSSHKHQFYIDRIHADITNTHRAAVSKAHKSSRGPSCIWMPMRPPNTQRVSPGNVCVNHGCVCDQAAMDQTVLGKCLIACARWLWEVVGPAGDGSLLDWCGATAQQDGGCDGRRTEGGHGGGDAGLRLGRAGLELLKLLL